jgi:3-oxoacyl-[acyl-carrier protein] reductase
MIFNGKTALITGASRGIGRAIATTFAQRGADVALIGRDVAALGETAQICANVRPGAIAELYEGDVTHQATVDRITGEVVARFGRVDFAIANAGQSVDALLLRLRPETVDRMLDVNLKSAFHLCAAVAKPMMKQRAGSIVLMTSIVGMTGNAGQAAYAASKAGLVGLCKSLAKELGSRNIRVNAVAPGLIETAMTEKMPDAAREFLIKQAALGRAGKPEDVSGVVAFLCSDDAGYITGQTLVVDGGILI